MVKKYEYINNVIYYFKAFSWKKAWSLLVEVGVGQVCSSAQLGAVFFFYLNCLLWLKARTSKSDIYHAQIVPYDLNHIRILKYKHYSGINYTTAQGSHLRTGSFYLPALQTFVCMFCHHGLNKTAACPGTIYIPGRKNRGQNVKEKALSL